MKTTTCCHWFITFHLIFILDVTNGEQISADQILYFHLNDLAPADFAEYVASAAASPAPGARDEKCIHNINELVKKMKDEGIYDPQFLAPDLDTAAREFIDLSNHTNLKVAEDYDCGASNPECARKSAQLKKDMLNSGWKLPFHESRFIHPNPAQYSPFIRPPALAGFSNASGVSFESRRKRRVKRSESGTDYVVDIGNVMLIGECATQNSESDIKEFAGKINLCGSCRAVAELRPYKYFPRFVNMVVCKSGPCLKGHGKCMVKHQELRILENIGTRFCQTWMKKTVQVPYCCSCSASATSRMNKEFFYDP